ncbi:hypothetical protein ACGFIP_12835 [Micromonospora zamorensis]|uniref:hypothetical protein n=1 Tax=Micromonospora zamorensis TaxID=709883 RepID=UPI00371951AB
MTNERVKSVGGYFMRFLGGVAVIIGILAVFSSLSQGNLVGIVLGVVFVAGGAFMLKRSGGASHARGAAPTAGSTR